jgi:hypothetical protein
MKIGNVAILTSLITYSLSTRVHGEIILGAGQSVVVQCGQNGGDSSTCTSDLTNWCSNNTTFGRNECYTQVARYCPSSTFSTCVENTAAYCRNNTTYGSNQCFTSALGTCQGNQVEANALFDEFVRAGRLLEKGITPQSLKPSGESAQVD